MKYLLFKIPTQHYLSEACPLNKNINLIPGGKLEHKTSAVTSNINYFWYAEKVSDKTKTMNLNNLKEFIRFWSFAFAESNAISHLENGNEPPILQTELPERNEAASCARSAESLDPNNVAIQIHPAKSKSKYKLCELFSTYLKADNDLKNYINLYLFNPARHTPNQWLTLYNNHYLKISLNFVIIDALTKADWCSSTISCPNGCKNQDEKNEHSFKHYKKTFRERTYKLLSNFEDKEAYYKIINYYRTMRGRVFHDAFIAGTPSIEPLPDIVGPHTRLISLDETIKKLKTEGLAADNAKILFNELVYTLLMNALYPDLDLWPKFPMLKSYHSKVSAR